jgi:hypothetical protein
MHKPTEEELNQALEEAERMREADEDPCYLAKSTQYLNRRVNVLEDVFEAANKYIHFGQEEREHAILLKAIQAAKRQEARETDEEEEDLGLS